MCFMENQALVRAIPRFEDKLRLANQMDGVSIAGGGKMAGSLFVNKRTCEIRCHVYRQMCIQRLPLFLSNFRE